MANQKFYQFLFSKVPMLTQISGSITLGASGAVSASSGIGVKSVTKLATGIYQIQLSDNYNSMVQADYAIDGPQTGSSVADGSFVTGTLYQITAVGNTNWTGAGLAAGLTAAVNQCFVATGAGGAGTGTAKAIGWSGIGLCEFAPAGQMLSPSSPNQGSLLLLQTYNNAATPALASGNTGAVIRFTIQLSNSSVTY